MCYLDPNDPWMIGYALFAVWSVAGGLSALSGDSNDTHRGGGWRITIRW